MTNKRCWSFVVIGLLSLTLTGCVYLRLLSLKNQLADFDRFVKVYDDHGLTLEFVHPVLTSEDLLWLIKLHPTQVTRSDNLETWSWTFEKQGAAASAESRNFDLTFKTSFTNATLCRFTLSERFLSVMPKEAILGMMRAVGQADIDERNRTAKAKVQTNVNGVTLEPASKTEVTRLLGAPCTTVESTSGQTCRYNYFLKTDTPGPAKTKEAWTVFTFDKTTDRLVHAEANFAGFRFRLDFAPAKG